MEVADNIFDMDKFIAAYLSTPKIVVSNEYTDIPALLRISFESLFEPLDDFVDAGITEHQRAVSTSQDDDGDSKECNLSPAASDDEDFEFSDDQCSTVFQQEDVEEPPEFQDQDLVTSDELNVSLESTSDECSFELETEEEFEDESLDFLERSKLSHEESEMMDPSDFIASLAVDDEFFLLEFDDVIQDPTEQLRAQPQLDEEIEIFLSEVYSPIHFWFHSGKGILEMEKQLQRDYSELKAKELAISDANFKPGLLVAVFFAPQWFRAKVINPLNKDDKVRLFLIDYGLVGCFSKSNIKLLYKRYLDAPRLSYRGRLFNIKPPFGQNNWEFKVIAAFLTEFSNLALKAKVMKFHEDEQIYELDATSVFFYKVVEIKINLRDWLIKRSYAEKFELQPGDIYPMCFYFPSTALLEENYPTLDEQFVMNIDRISFQLLLETQHFSNVTTERLSVDFRLLSMLGHEKFKEIKEFFFPTRK